MDKVTESNETEQKFKKEQNDEDANVSTSQVNSRVKWSKEDKKTLLKALQTYGPKNITALSKMLPHIPPRDIKLKIYRYTVISEYLYEDELINEWMKCGLYRHGESPIPEALLFIQMFENHPSFTEFKDYDFRAIYNFLYHATFEKSPVPSISEKSRRVIFHLISKIDKKLWPKCQQDLWNYLGKVYNRRNIWKVYKGKQV